MTLQAAGALAMATATSVPMLLFSVVLLSVGAVLFSGTLEALVYDSLKEAGQAERYEKVQLNITSLQLIVPALCGIVGGFMYAVDARLPYVANGLLYLAGAFAALLLYEPKIDSEKFSLRAFIFQQKQGLRELFQTHSRKLILFLLAAGAVVLVTTEVLDNMLSIEFGFRDNQLGILWAVIYVASGAALHLVTKSGTYTKRLLGNTVACVLIALSLVASPIAGLWAGGTLLFIRSVLGSILGNTTSVTINGFVDSKYRATTLSTFNMLKSIPYAITALGIGAIADAYSAKIPALALGAMLIAIVGIWLANTPWKGAKNSQRPLTKYTH